MGRNKIVSRNHKRFTYVSDIILYGKHEKWVSPPRKGKVQGDCEDFAIMNMHDLRRAGFKAELATVGLNSKKLNHCVCISGNWVIDNIHARPMRRWEIPNYNFIAMTNGGKKWYKILKGK